MDVVVSPKGGDMPDVATAITDYSNVLFHCHAVMGVNTTAIIEAAVVDKPCIALVTDYYAITQQNIGHFQHLLRGGFMEIASDANSLAHTLNRVLAGEDRLAQARRDFVRDFVRPNGLERPAAEVLAETLMQIVEGDV